MSGDADAVVLDLEDAVPPRLKHVGRTNAVAAAGVSHPKPLWIRVNGPDSQWGSDDLTALDGCEVEGLRLPKSERPEQVQEVHDRTGLPVHAVIETALGVQNSYALADCPAVTLLSLGEADLMADMRVRDLSALNWARVRLVTAARAAGLPSPVQSAWTDVADIKGLIQDTERGYRAGSFGRSVLHPSQVAPVNRIFTPDSEEVSKARARLAGADRADAAWLDGDGNFVDPALLASARWLVDLDDALRARGKR